MSFADLARRLTARAAALAAARVALRRRSARGDGGHWRAARLLWPLFIREGR